MAKLSNTSAPGATSTPARKPVVVKAVRKGPVLTSHPVALKWLLDHVNVERISPSRLKHDTIKLDRMIELAQLLGNPHHAFKSVHVAGTKGKGSTCEMTAAGLEACGYTVGIYTSPHLIDMRERIRINRSMISHADFVRVAQRVADAAANLDENSGEATFFELLTAMAFVHFAEQAVDIAVVEVGLGGRLDSTNIITPEVSAVTSISLDHMEILGDTVEKIAREKAGVFKPGVTALSVQQKPGVIEVFREVAERVGAPLRVVGKEIEFSARFEASQALGPHMRVGLMTPRVNFEHLVVPLKGEHQAYNCGLALAIMDALHERGFAVPESKVSKGLASVSMPGRMEIIGQSPRVLLDGAHNADSMRALIKAIGAQVRYDSMVVIFGCSSDKDVAGMLREVALGADKVIFTRVQDNARAANPRELARRFAEDSGKMCQVAETFEEALNLAQRAVGRDDLICVTGSLFLVGEAKKALSARKPTGR